MKNPILILIAVSVVVILGISAYAFYQKTSGLDSKMKIDEAVIQKDTQNKVKDDTFMKKNETIMDKSADSRYVEYSKVTFDQVANIRRVLFFYASWCPTCRPTDANLKENASKIPEDVIVIRVNYNDPETDQEEKDLAKKYGTSYQHTFVQIDAQGKEVTKWNGGQINELLSNIK